MRCASEVTEGDIDQLVKRLCQQTKPLDEDRNRVRAHVHERSVDLGRAFQNLADLKGQLHTLDTLVQDLAKEGLTVEVSKAVIDELVKDAGKGKEEKK